MQNITTNSTLTRMARIGYVAKGLTYLLLGILAFITAFELGRSLGEASRGNVFRLVRNLPAGVVLMGALALGLACYALWRMIQAFAPQYGHEKKKIKRVLYFFSGLAYAGVALAAVKMALWQESSDSDQQQTLAATLLARKGGQWLTGIAALVFFGTGIHQIYFGWSGKYRKYIKESRIDSRHSGLLLRSGQVGYIARGMVWLVIGYLLLQAALLARASKAGDTSAAFRFLESSPMGSYLLGAVGFGFAAFGVFNLLRARYEQF